VVSFISYYEYAFFTWGVFIRAKKMSSELWREGRIFALVYAGRKF